MIFGPSDAKFQEVFEGIKKWIYQKWPKQRDSNGRPEHLKYLDMFQHKIGITSLLHEKAKR